MGACNRGTEGAEQESGVSGAAMSVGPGSRAEPNPAADLYSLCRCSHRCKEKAVEAEKQVHSWAERMVGFQGKAEEVDHARSFQLAAPLVEPELVGTVGQDDEIGTEVDMRGTEVADVAETGLGCEERQEGSLSGYDDPRSRNDPQARLAPTNSIFNHTYK